MRKVRDGAEEGNDAGGSVLTVHLLATAALIGLSLFVLACVTVQFLRPELDWRYAPMSFYLLGPYGIWLQAAYCALGGALMLLAAGYYRVLQPQARSGAPVLLFVMAGLALCVTAIADSNLPQREPTLQGWLHGIAAQAAFLCVTTAMLLQSWRMRADARWRSRFLPALLLALAAFIAIWVLALWRDAPRGLAQKAVMALIVCWVAMTAGWLRHQSRIASREQSGRGTFLPPPPP